MTQQELKDRVSVCVTHSKDLLEEAYEKSNSLADSLKKEAEDHTKLLIDLQQCDPEYDRLLRQNYYRKQVVMQILNESKGWKRMTGTVRKI